MTEKKYELTDEIVFLKKDDNSLLKLNRIRALMDFTNVKKGDLGGFVQDERNLSHNGNCWVSGNAKVYGSASVHDNAEICGEAEVFSEAMISGNAIVSERAKVFGNAIVEGKSGIFQDAVVKDQARVYDMALVYGTSVVSENASVYGYAKVECNTTVKGSAKVHGQAIVGGATLEEKADIYGHTMLYDPGHFQIPIGKTPIKLYIFCTETIITDKHIIIGCTCKTTSQWEKLMKDGEEELKSIFSWNDSYFHVLKRYGEQILSLAKEHQKRKRIKINRQELEEKIEDILSKNEFLHWKSDEEFILCEGKCDFIFRKIAEKISTCHVCFENFTADMIYKILKRFSCEHGCWADEGLSFTTGINRRSFEDLIEEIIGLFGNKTEVKSN